MERPLALILYERIYPGGTLANRLQDLGYRVKAVTQPEQLTSTAEQEKPIVAFVDVDSRYEQICEAIRALRQNASTAHVPIIALIPGPVEERAESARNAGADLVVQENAILSHLPQFLEQALRVD